jgi:hypothetical protein
MTFVGIEFAHVKGDDFAEGPATGSADRRSAGPTGPSELPHPCALPEPIAGPERIAQLDVRRRNRLGGTLHKYRHAA